jgi:hypothetical protein
MKLSFYLVLACFLMVAVSDLGAQDAKDGMLATGSGTLAESISVGNYVYLRLEEPDRWIATSPLEVAVGDRVNYSDGMEMKGFYSKALDRTFESVLFVQNVSVAGQDADKMHESAIQNQGADHPAIGKAIAVETPVADEIPPLEGGKTVAGIYTDSTSLEGEVISVRARVIKVSANIMGKNWITLSDGSGSAPDDKLMTTSAEMPNPGDVVIASGTLRKDVDIGAGYNYKVLLEGATFSP